MKIYDRLLDTINRKGAAYLVLIDPDKTNGVKLAEFARQCENSGVDGFLVGGSLVVDGDLKKSVEILKDNTELPVILFPGSVSQVLPEADAILFISLISGRNAEHIIGKHVISAPLIKKYGIEPLSTGYMLVESGRVTTAEYMSGSAPLPRNKPEIAAATALAAEYLGMKFVYLEAGSGADNPVPDAMVKAVTSVCSIPVMVGGGIKDPEAARNKVRNGAKIVVTGNFFEDETNWGKIKEFAEAVHINDTVKA